MDHADLERLRSLCVLLPEVAEIDGLGRPTFRGATRAFASFELVDGRSSVTVKLPLDHQARVLAQAGCEPEDETGHHGWTALDVATLGWAEVDELVVASYRLVAPAHLVAVLDAVL
jgi:hypothetical protein